MKQHRKRPTVITPDLRAKIKELSGVMMATDISLEVRVHPSTISRIQRREGFPRFTRGGRGLQP
jgi:hypothetical protein